MGEKFQINRKKKRTHKSLKLKNYQSVNLHKNYKSRRNNLHKL